MLTDPRVRLLMRWYSLSAESAVEILSELRCKKSLERLARCGGKVARAVVPTSSPSPNDLLGASSHFANEQSATDATAHNPPLVGLKCAN
jgi:hypothetical protein